MLALALAVGMLANSCPVTIGIARDGAVFSSRMQGWFKMSEKTLASDLRGGCYNDAEPAPVSSVRVEIAPHAPKKRVDEVFAMLKKAGWPRARIKVEAWKNDPQEPR